jgi:undecaprenyl-diphosphatase
LSDYLIAFLLGIVEGVTEFLPVSSTAHLRICEAWLGIDLEDGFWKMFSIVIQLGAILCLPIYFRTRLKEFMSTFPHGRRGEYTLLTHPASLVMIAFVCTAIPSFLLSKVIGKNLENLVLMAMSLVIGGVVMWVVDGLYSAGLLSPAGRRVEEVGEMKMGQAVWIGLLQSLAAVFPGASRSMTTIAAGQLARLSRSAALEFSFLLSIPTMCAATLYDFYKATGATAEHPLGGVVMTPQNWITLTIGMVVSFVVAYLVVAWFMHWVRKRGFVPFAIYRILFGFAVLIWALRS